MQHNRRNYYRILHVQPEAPLEVIKASYRCLMTTLRLHPDRGGEHDMAVLINQAYAVLSDPDKRRQYDRFLAQRRTHGTPQARQARPQPSPPPTGTSRGGCAFCGQTIGFTVEAQSRCPRCDSPLGPVPHAKSTLKGEAVGRRCAQRIARRDSAVVYPGWALPGHHARLCDLSPVGLCFITGHPVRIGQVIRIVCPVLDCVSRVVTARPAGSHYTVHTQFLSVAFPSQAGAFVSARV